MESVPSGDTWKVPWDVPAKNRSWFPWREDKIKLVSFRGSFLAAHGKAGRAAGFNNFNNLCCIWIGNLGGAKFPLKSFSHTRSCEPEQLATQFSILYVSSEQTQWLSGCCKSLFTMWTLSLDTGHLNNPGCEVRGNYLTQPTQNNLNVPPTFRYQPQATQRLSISNRNQGTN